MHSSIVSSSLAFSCTFAVCGVHVSKFPNLKKPETINVRYNVLLPVLVYFFSEGPDLGMRKAVCLIVVSIRFTDASSKHYFLGARLQVLQCGNKVISCRWGWAFNSVSSFIASHSKDHFNNKSKNYNIIEQSLLHPLGALHTKHELTCNFCSGIT